MGRGGAWTPLQLKHLAEAMLAASEDPIAGVDQKANVFRDTMWQFFVDRDPFPASKKYSSRSPTAVFSQSKIVNKDILRFQSSVMFVNACKPTGGCSEDNITSLMIAHHLGMMPKDKLDYDCKDTCHDEWVYAQAYKVLRKSPKWQCNDGPVMSMNGGASGRTVIRGASASPDSDASSGVVLVGSAADSTGALMVGDDLTDAHVPPTGRKKAKRIRSEEAASSAVAIAMAKSISKSASSIEKNAVAQTERNGIMIFSSRLSDMDDDSQEYFKLLRRTHLANARAAAPPLQQTQALDCNDCNVLEDGDTTGDYSNEISPQ
jgi:hypothetical protein